jgi:hypothetical protein
MKRLLFLLGFLPVLAFAQSFVVTPDGLKNVKDSTSSFLVLNFEGQPVEQLYAKTIKFVNEYTVSPADDLKGNIKDEYVRFSSVQPGLFYNKSGLVNAPVDCSYDTELKFKDGKVRLEFNSIEMSISASGFPVLFSGPTFGHFVIFNDKGQLINAEAKKAIEDYFNNQVKLYVSYLNKNSGDNW